jgi:glycosyltransferase involved in cell wall biosynthesis
MLSQADVALGAFGGTAKAARVIPCKVYDALMIGVPVITAATPAVGRVLRHRLNAILIPPNDPETLAQEILVLKSDPVLRSILAVEGKCAFIEIGKPEVVGRKVRSICEEVGARFTKEGASVTSEAKLKP